MKNTWKSSAATFLIMVALYSIANYFIQGHRFTIGFVMGWIWDPIYKFILELIETE